MNRRLYMIFHLSPQSLPFLHLPHLPFPTNCCYISEKPTLMSRFVLLILLSVCFFSCKNEPTAPPLTENTQSLRDENHKPFYHGVASGDPYPESVILWTRVTPETQLNSIVVGWEISDQEDFSSIAQTGSFTTNP